MEKRERESKRGKNFFLFEIMRFYLYEEFRAHIPTHNWMMLFHCLFILASSEFIIIIFIK